MHRKPQLQEAARTLQEIFNSRTGDITYVQALEILGKLEGFEGYQQLRDFVARHSQLPAKEAMLQAAPEPLKPVAASNGPRQTLAMALCGHGGFDEAYKRVQTGHPNIRFVSLSNGELREIAFVKDGSVLMTLADNDAGFPHKTALDPEEVVARVKGGSNWGDSAWSMGFPLTVADMQAAQYQLTRSSRGWMVGGKSIAFWNATHMPAPAPVTTTAPKPENMSRETYIALSDELERHERAHAMGQDTEYTYHRMSQIDALLDASPWCRDMDTGGVVLKSESIYGTAPKA